MPQPKRPRAIQPLAPAQCPRCNGERTFLVTREKIECQQCGYVLPSDAVQATPTAKTTPPPRDLSQYKVSYRITHEGGVEAFVEAAYNTALDCLRRQDWAGAIAALRRCIDYREDFTDAHLWLGRLLDDPAARRDHLTTILAHQPTHPEALRELMILDGDIAAPAADFDEYTMPEQRTVNAAISTDLKNIRCPQCGSPRLSDDDAQGVIYCLSCGYRQQRQQAIAAFQSLSAALIKRRSQPVQWIVGDRWLHCDSCGATRTIPAHRLAETCAFCGSKNVIERDALNTFQQPEGILPFAIPEPAAMQRVLAQLKTWNERVKGMFNANQVKRWTIEGVFLPFWAFDAVVEVRRTTNDTRGYLYDRKQSASYRVENIAEMANNVLVSGVKSPPAQLTQKLGAFPINRAVAYDADLLTQHAAEIYAIDFDQAAMDVHGRVSETMREKYQVASRQRDLTVTAVSFIKQMTFRLVLLPVYSVLLYEVDGDVRPALVNGHSGRVVLGKASAGVD